MGKILWTLVGLSLIGMTMTDKKPRTLGMEDYSQKNFEYYIRLYFEHAFYFIAKNIRHKRSERKASNRMKKMINLREIYYF